MKNIIPLFVIAVLIVLSPEMGAVVPAPDGGYPGGNTAEGQSALLSLTTGGFNTAVGLLSLRSDTSGQLNTAIGAGTLLANTADENTAAGAGALLSNTTGSQNTASGAFALFNNTEGGSNTVVGRNALLSNTIGGTNTAIGVNALSGNTTGNSNIAVGLAAGQFNVTGSSNIYIGNTGGDESGTIRIGGGSQIQTFIASIRGVTTQNADAIPVLIDSAGQLGTANSSRRFKKEIKSMDAASEAILALKPVTFHYKSDKTGTPQFGLIAEEVAEVNPDLVVRNENGEIYTVRYDAVNTMLLNEFLKEHRKVEQLNSTVTKQAETIMEQRKDFETTISELRKEIETVVAYSQEEDAKIQRVSAQIELNRPAMKLVRDSH